MSIGVVHTNKINKISELWLIKRFEEQIKAKKEGELTVREFLEKEGLYSEDGDLAKRVGKVLGRHKDKFKSERKRDPIVKNIATFWSLRE